MSRKLTIVFLVAALCGLIAWDVVVAVNDTSGDTISEIVLAYSKRFWVIPVATGVVMGHLFWPLRRPRALWLKFAIVGGAAVAAIALDAVGHVYVSPVIPFAIGVLMGHFGWGQREV